MAEKERLITLAGELKANELTESRDYLKTPWERVIFQDGVFAGYKAQITHDNTQLPLIERAAVERMFHKIRLVMVSVYGKDLNTGRKALLYKKIKAGDWEALKPELLRGE